MNFFEENLISRSIHQEETRIIRMCSFYAPMILSISTYINGPFAIVHISLKNSCI